MMKPFLVVVLLTLSVGAYASETRELKRIFAAALQNQQAYQKLSYLTDRIGARLSGSERLDEAIEWAYAQMKSSGLSNVAKQPVKVPVWLRHDESAAMVMPVSRKLSMLGLGGSIATPPGGIRASVEVVHSFDELSPAAKGKIVLFNVPFTNYSETVRYRFKAASEAAKHGAVAALVRSVTPRSLSTPHTGAMRYEDGVSKIAAAAISIEDAELIDRLRRDGQEVVVQLDMQAETRPDADSANVIGEIVGSGDEVVVLGAHIDSWDVGQGAQDDGGGVVTVLEAARILRELKIKPKRTIRVVLFTNEENGLRGAKAYFAQYKDSIGKHVAAIETDYGMDRPIGIDVEIPKSMNPKKYFRSIQNMTRQLKPIAATRLKEGEGGADLGPLAEAGVPTMAVVTDAKTYWQVHHSPADTLDKILPENLNRHIALMAAMAYMLAR